MRVLIISNVWIEPSSSAAGRRMLQLLEMFMEQGWELTYVSTAKASAHGMDLEAKGIATQTVAMNDDGFNAFAKALAPHIVLFDRFMVEEQFGWRIAQACPDALRILDTEDLHCLRKARQRAIQEGRAFSEKDLYSDVAKREIASIYRCDLSLVISTVEMELLQRLFKVPKNLVRYLPFTEEPPTASLRAFRERAHFVSIGNFLHAPNWDASLQLKKVLWPAIRRVLPEAQLHVYGAYPSEKVWQLHNKKEGFLVLGRAENAVAVITQARVLLAPLRFGAGLKGKFIDAMQCGTPSVTTHIGAEGMAQGLPWGGRIANDDDAFIKGAIDLYTQEQQWKKAQQQGFQMLRANFQKVDFQDDLMRSFLKIYEDLEKHRRANFTGQMLQHHTTQSTKFMSKWIEEKNKVGFAK